MIRSIAAIAAQTLGAFNYHVDTSWTFSYFSSLLDTSVLPLLYILNNLISANFGVLRLVPQKGTKLFSSFKYFKNINFQSSTPLLNCNLEFLKEALKTWEILTNAFKSTIQKEHFLGNIVCWMYFLTRRSFK